MVGIVHISGVRASCGCTTPSISKDTLKTWETGAIIAKFNTDSFLGKKSATLTVTIDKPFYAEVQLNVAGYIRSDIVFNPGAVRLEPRDEVVKLIVDCLQSCGGAFASGGLNDPVIDDRQSAVDTVDNTVSSAGCAWIKT